MLKKKHSGTFNYIRRHKIGGGLLAILLCSFGGPLNFFGSNPNIFYLPAVIACICILYFTHEYVTSLKSPRGNNTVGAQTTEPAPPSEGPRESIPPTPKKPRFSEKASGLFTVLIGNNQFSWDGRSPIPILHLNRDLVTAKVVDNELRIDATLPGPQGDVKLIDNELSNRPPMWDRNFDDSAIEIVNENGNPMFQLEYVDERTAKVRGIFSDGNALVIANDNGLVMNPTSDTKLSSPLFKYPFLKHKGERR